jgi:sialic acid synthase SpsE
MTFIIAEIGVNWDGDFEILKKLMNHSKSVGCDAVKFQAYNEEIVKAHPENQRLMKSAISLKNIEKVDQLARETGIEWFATPMYEDAVDLLEPYVKRFKIREFDSRNIVENKQSKILEKILRTDKEIIISSQKSPKNSTQYGKSNIKWLYCVPKYPASLQDLDFSKLGEFDGYSNHVPQIIAPLTAAILGAKIVEVHITPSKQKNFIDNNVSFDLEELKNLVSLIRDSEKIKMR